MISPDLNKHFISFEGIDFSGKSTQINLLKEYIREKGARVYVLREPGGTEISEQIRKVLLDKKHGNMHPRAELLLYSAARIQLTTEKIIPTLKRDAYVIADRFVDSTTAYQGYGRGLQPDMIAYINQVATLGLLPSVTFYLDIEPKRAFERCAKRGNQKDRLESAGLDFFKKVAQGYKEIARNYPNRFHVMDAMEDVKTIHNHIVEILKNKNILSD
ncbi:MAG: dTMP kinase [Calditrichaeota bacterium]|nr:MAG: dTMP kinase [Calditrichota bacterium]